MKQVIILLAFLFPLSVFSQGTTSVTLYSVEDAGTRSGAALGGNNMGSNTTMDVAKYAIAVGRSFVKFDLSSIPSDAVIISATLRLTPSGTENVTATNSTQLYLDVCNTLWTEGTITYNTGISNNTLYATVGVSSLVNSKREFVVKDHLQAMVEKRLPNYGWRIRRSDETSTTVTSTYFTRENTTLDYSPQLVVQYYRRSYVSAATIVHNSSVTGSGNGSISPTVQYGSSASKTFRWFDASGTQIGTTQNLTGRTSGWYGLKYWGTTAGDTTYQAFLIGTECEEVAITFNPGPNYVDDSRITSLTTGAGTTIVDYRSMNYPTDNLPAEYWVSGSDKYESRSLLRFRLWVDPNLQVKSASMTLTGNGHNPLEKTNESELDRVTANWYETGVGWNNPLTYSSTDKILMAALPAGNSNSTSDLAGFFNTWKTDNTQNYGMLFRLQNLEDSYSRMQFYSSDATTAANRPKIVFTIKTSTCDLTRKGAVTITDADASLKKGLSVSLEPISWAVSPYRYVVSDQVIPEPRAVLKYLNDSVFDPDLDSTSFFRGNVAATSFNFGNLDYGTYNVAVFDNNGKRVFESTGTELYPAITFLASSNATVVDNNTIRPSSAANATCELNAFVNTYNQGTVKMKATVLSGSQYYGFLDATTTLSSGSNIRYGYRISGSSLYPIVNSKEGSAITINTNSTLSLSFVNDTIIYKNDTTVIVKSALTSGYSFKLGAVMNSASRTRILLERVPIRPFSMVTQSGTERTCGTTTGNFQFNLSGFLSTQFGNYNYQLVANNTNESVTTYSGTGLNNELVPVNNVPPGMYTLTCTQTGVSSPITMTKTVYIGVQASWFSTHPNYNLSPNSYSLQRDNVNPVSTYSSALSTNIMSSGAKGWVWFTPVATASSGVRNDYLTIAESFGNLQVPGTSQTFLSFRRMLPTLSYVGGVFVTIPGGVQVNWRDAANSSSGSATLPLNAFVTIEMTGTVMNVKSNGLLVTSVTQPSGPIRLKANSNRTGEGFKDVHTTFVCTAAQTIDQIGYYELGRDYTAGYATAVGGKLKFTFDEEYAVEDSKKLRYIVYNDANTVIASGDLNGTVTGGATALTYSFDDNRYTLNISLISAIAAGKYYHLEVITSTGQKRYLRFLYKN